MLMNIFFPYLSKDMGSDISKARNTLTFKLNSEIFNNNDVIIYASNITGTGFFNI